MHLLLLNIQYICEVVLLLSSQISYHVKVIKNSVFSYFLQVVNGWHDLTNVEFHCWPFGANDDDPKSFPVCVGE